MHDLTLAYFSQPRDGALTSACHTDLLERVSAAHEHYCHVVRGSRRPSVMVALVEWLLPSIASNKDLCKDLLQSCLADEALGFSDLCILANILQLICSVQPLPEVGNITSSVSCDSTTDTDDVHLKDFQRLNKYLCDFIERKRLDMCCRVDGLSSPLLSLSLLGDHMNVTIFERKQLAISTRSLWGDDLEACSFKSKLESLKISEKLIVSQLVQYIETNALSAFFRALVGLFAMSCDCDSCGGSEPSIAVWMQHMTMWAWSQYGELEIIWQLVELVEVLCSHCHLECDHIVLLVDYTSTCLCLFQQQQSLSALPNDSRYFLEFKCWLVGYLIPKLTEKQLLTNVALLHVQSSSSWIPIKADHYSPRTNLYCGVDGDLPALILCLEFLKNHWMHLDCDGGGDYKYAASQSCWSSGSETEVRQMIMTNLISLLHGWQHVFGIPKCLVSFNEGNSKITLPLHLLQLHIMRAALVCAELDHNDKSQNGTILTIVTVLSDIHLALSAHPLHEDETPQYQSWSHNILFNKLVVSAMHLLLNYLDGALPDLHFVGLPLPSVASKFVRAFDSICAIITALDFLRMDTWPNNKTQSSLNRHSDWQVLIWESIELFNLPNRHSCNSLSCFLPHLILTTYTRLSTAGTRHQQLSGMICAAVACNPYSLWAVINSFPLLIRSMEESGTSDSYILSVQRVVSICEAEIVSMEKSIPDSDYQQYCEICRKVRSETESRHIDKSIGNAARSDDLHYDLAAVKDFSTNDCITRMSRLLLADDTEYFENSFGSIFSRLFSAWHHDHILKYPRVLTSTLNRLTLSTLSLDSTLQHQIRNLLDTAHPLLSSFTDGLLRQAVDNDESRCVEVLLSDIENKFLSVYDSHLTQKLHFEVLTALKLDVILTSRAAALDHHYQQITSEIGNESPTSIHALLSCMPLPNLNAFSSLLVHCCRASMGNLLDLSVEALSRKCLEQSSSKINVLVQPLVMLPACMQVICGPMSEHVMVRFIALIFADHFEQFIYLSATVSASNQTKPEQHLAYALCCLDILDGLSIECPEEYFQSLISLWVPQMACDLSALIVNACLCTSDSDDPCDTLQNALQVTRVLIYHLVAKNAQLFKQQKSYQLQQLGFMSIIALSSMLPLLDAALLNYPSAPPFLSIEHVIIDLSLCSHFSGQSIALSLFKINQSIDSMQLPQIAESLIVVNDKVSGIAKFQWQQAKTGLWTADLTFTIVPTMENVTNLDPKPQILKSAVWKFDRICKGSCNQVHHNNITSKALDRTWRSIALTHVIRKYLLSLEWNNDICKMLEAVGRFLFSKDSLDSSLTDFLVGIIRHYASVVSRSRDIGFRTSAESLPCFWWATAVVMDMPSKIDSVNYFKHVFHVLAELPLPFLAETWRAGTLVMNDFTANDWIDTIGSSINQVLIRFDRKLASSVVVKIQRLWILSACTIWHFVNINNSGNSVPACISYMHTLFCGCGCLFDACTISAMTTMVNDCCDYLFPPSANAIVSDGIISTILHCNRGRGQHPADALPSLAIENPGESSQRSPTRGGNERKGLIRGNLAALVINGDHNIQVISPESGQAMPEIADRYVPGICVSAYSSAQSSPPKTTNKVFAPVCSGNSQPRGRKKQKTASIPEANPTAYNPPQTYDITEVPIVELSNTVVSASSNTWNVPAVDGGYESSQAPSISLDTVKEFAYAQDADFKSSAVGNFGVSNSQTGDINEHLILPAATQASEYIADGVIAPLPLIHMDPQTEDRWSFAGNVLSKFGDAF